MRKKFIKVISVVTVCIIAVFGFSFNSLAVSTNTLSVAFDAASARLDWDDSQRISGIISGNKITFDYDFEADTIYVLTLRLLPQLPDGEYRYESFSGYFNINDDFYFQTQEVHKERFKCYRYPWNVDSPIYDYGEATVTDWWIKFDFDFPTDYLPTETCYYFDFLVYCKNDSDLTLTFKNLDIQFLTADEYTDSYNTDKIINNQNENTDKILNGDEDLDVSDKTGAVDGSVGDMENATDEVLGGKSDEEINDEINNALDSDKIDIDFDRAGKLSDFFDNLLKCFGVSYQTVLLLSLSLGLGAFLIGRRYG